MLDVVTGHSHEPALTPALVDSMHVLRSEVFFDRLQWEVTSENGRERDWFDRLDPRYMIVRDSNEPDVALGSWRLLPTTGPYMLKDVFPELLHGAPAPCAANIWEISRFAVSKVDRGVGFGFNEVPLALIRAVVLYARSHGISEFVAVTSVGVERLLRKAGLVLERLGPAIQIGDVRAVAFRAPMDEAAEKAVCRTVQTHLRAAA